MVLLNIKTLLIETSKVFLSNLEPTTSELLPSNFKDLLFYF